MSDKKIIQTDLSSVLTVEEITEIDRELVHIPYKSGAAIDALKIVQKARGWVSDECLQAIAKHLEMSSEELEGVATFYNLIYRRPVGDKVILFCDSVSCWINGCDDIKKRSQTSWVLIMVRLLLITPTHCCQCLVWVPVIELQ